MKMYRRPSKKRELTKRIAIYVVMTSLVIVIVTGLIFITLGYRFDTDNGRVEQGALLQFATIPSGATVEIDGKPMSAKTPTKSSVLAGSHEFVMWRDGYETWRKNIDVAAGTLTWLNYTRLIPKDRTVVPVAQYPSLLTSLATTDGQNMLVQQDGTVPTFQLVNLQSDEIKTTTLTIPAALYSEASTVGVKHDFNVDQWDNGGRYVLIRHNYGEKKEWLVLDTRDVSATKNITKLLSLDVASMKFSGTSGNILYGLSGTDIRKLDLSAGTISGSLVSNVTKFELFETNVITYVGTVQNDSTKRVVGLYREGDSKPHILRTVTSAPDVPLVVATSRYFNQDYVAIAEGNKVDIIRGSYPSSSGDDNKSLGKFSTFSFVTAVDRLLFSPAGDYLLVQSGANFASYDIEHKKVDVSTVAKDVTAAVGPLKWLDDSHVWSDYGGNVNISEFDGANNYSINPVASSQAVVLSQNGRYLYSVGKTKAGYQLQRVRMI
ncbi:PEGA domain-containing protein, partial [Candidatus Saccharibacteria bacterium]|nr:PEGA domain-containing protein [Candidatus Saccharibacteria bacterium]